MSPHAEMVRMVSVQWRGRNEVMTIEEADELRHALGRATTLNENNANLIIWTTCDVFNVLMKLVLSDCRTEAIATARQAAMYLLRELTPLTLDEVGELFPRENGKPRDHGTVHHAVQVTTSRCKQYKRIAEKVAAVRVAILEKK